MPCEEGHYKNAGILSLLGAAYIFGAGLLPVFGIAIYEAYFDRARDEKIRLYHQEKAEFEKAYGRVGVAQLQLNASALSLGQDEREKAYENLLEAVNIAIKEGTDVQKSPHLRSVDETLGSLTATKENLELILQTKQ